MTMLAGVGAIAPQGKTFSAEKDASAGDNEKKLILLKERVSSVAWKGDVVVVGATMGGMSVAVTAARMGKKVLVIESQGVLGTETSSQWNERIPEGWLADDLAGICRPHGGFNNGTFDPFVTTLAWDRLAESAGVACMVCVVPVRAVCDSDGLLKGVEIVGKSGRQLVAAPIVVDATQGGSFSRRACGLSGQVPGSITRRMYVQGVPVVELGKEISVPERLGLLRNQVEVQATLWANEVILGYSISASPAVLTETSFALETYHKGLLVMEHLRKKNKAFANALLVDVAPKWQIEFAPGAEPKGLKNTGLIPLMNPAKAVNDKQWVSRFVGAACELKKRQPLPVKLMTGVLSGNEPAKTDELRVTVERDCEETTLSGIQALLHDPSDVVVAGYGTGGIFASLSAAWQGVSVTVLDPAGIPGGMGTAGKIHSYYHGIRAGMQKTIDEKTSVATTICGKAGGFHHVAKVETMMREMENAKIRVEVGYRVFGVIKKGNAVEAVVAAGEDGYHVFPCKVAIDATGDGDLAAAAGAQYTLGRDRDGFPQPYSYTPTMTRGGRLAHHNFDAGWVDPTDTMDYSLAHFTGRARLWDKGPFTDKNHYCSLASLLGLRESRFIKGAVTLTFSDFMEGKTYPDTVCAMYAHYDNHAIDYAQESDWAWRHVVMFGLWRYLCKGDIPYRCLYPADVEGVLLACRAFSIDHDLHQLARMIPDIQQVGEICGLAAAIAVKTGKAPSAINVTRLRELLKDRGVLPAEVPQPAFNLPSGELFQALGGDKNGLAMWRLAQKLENDKPDWDGYFKTQTDAKKKFAAAVAAIMRGDVLPEAVQVLEAAIKERVDEPKLGIKSPARYIVAALALASVKSPGIENRIEELLKDSSLSGLDVMLLYRGLGCIGGTKAIQVIRDNFGRGNSYENSLWGQAPQFKTPVTFIVELCAVRELQAMGCFEESSRLGNYRNSSSVLVRRYARRLAAAKK